jgi:tetratricopeptide (TPR) repeat protein
VSSSRLQRAARARAAAHLRLATDPEPRPTNALVEEAQLAERQGRREEARTLYERALYQLSEPKEAPLASALLRWIGRTYQVDADLEAALDCLEAAHAVAEACGDRGAAGHAINLQANVHFVQGEIEAAERLYLEARKSALEAADAKLAAMTAQNLGVIANVRGDLPQALQHYETSLVGYRALGLPTDVWGALNNLGMLYTDLQRWDAAERAYEEAVQISTALGDLNALILLHVNLAELWLARADYDRARQSCDRAMALADQLGDTLRHGEAYKVYGVIARETGDHTLAEEQFARATA